MKHIPAFAFLLVASVVAAQTPTVPPTSRTVYRCEVAGKTVYSDSPCPGAVRVNVEPTRGVNKLSGKERVGRDVREERFNEAMANALYPIFQETPDQRALRHRRAKLKPEVQQECAALDGRLAASETAERSARGEALSTVRTKLYQDRLKHRQLRC